MCGFVVIVVITPESSGSDGAGGSGECKYCFDKKLFSTIVFKK